ncbi:MAG: pyruvate kinase [Saprospiraceae bacterium]|nr:pyruvate kinase [Saprospiraceae bacterium]
MNVEKLIQEINSILVRIEIEESNIDEITASIHKQYKKSAKNLCRYLLLRNYDLRKHHDYLSNLGVSSLRSSEGYVYSNLYHVVKNLHLIADLPFDHPEHIEKIGYKKSKKLLKKHANELFNSTSKKHFTEIMVTLPIEAAEDKNIIRGMVMNGMEIARINLSHGNQSDWQKMVEIIHDVKDELNRDVKIYMDLAGPKIRTSNIEIIDKKGRVKNSIKVRRGEHIILTKQSTTWKKSRFGEANEQLEKAEVGVMLPEIIDDVQIGDEILFDDGMIHAKVLNKFDESIEIVITNCYKSKLSSRKGINLPNTQLNLPALTASDLKNLPFVKANADIVGYSFVRNGADVNFLYKHLFEDGNMELGVVFKIENKEAFQNLPQILIEGMKHNKIGVMIARGDLAVEIGFERISEVQNQILWICEAAHIPVIWATQVLENLAKTGIPTRAEVSDAAYGAHAECVMLNKGPYINDAISMLKDILIRMESHSFKRKNSLRPLNLAIHAVQDILGSHELEYI